MDGLSVAVGQGLRLGWNKSDLQLLIVFCLVEE